MSAKKEAFEKRRYQYFVAFDSIDAKGIVGAGNLAIGLDEPIYSIEIVHALQESIAREVCPGGRIVITNWRFFDEKVPEGVHVH
jgi:hypothetical protein